MNRLKRNRSTFKGARAKAIKYILDHPEIAAFLSIDILAEKIGISTSSLSRTAVDTGYSGYQEMQNEVQEYLRQKLLPTVRMEQAVPESGKFSFRDSLRKDMDSIRYVLENMADRQFDAAIQMLLDAREVFVVGLGTQFPSALYFSGVMKQIRQGVTLISQESMDYLDCFSRFSPKDVLVPICLPRYGMFTVRAAKEAAEKGCRIVAVTDNELSPTGRLADVVLQVGYESMSFFNSNVAVMALLNALATTLALRRRDAAHERVEMFSNIATRWNIFYKKDQTESAGEEK